jgi:hypothetical protein
MHHSGLMLGLALLSSSLLCWADKTGTNASSLKPVPEISAEQPFTQPKTLAELLSLSAADLEKVDLGRMNLLCAEGLRGSEGLDVESCVSTLDAWARHVERETKRNFHHFASRPEEFNRSLPYYQMGMLGTVLAEDLKIQYNPEREQQLLGQPVSSQTIEQEKAFFSSSKDVFIHGLLTGRHTGTCASMPFLYAAIGRRLGYPVTIAARKYHLYVRYDAGNGAHLNIEATENRGFATPTDEEYRNGPYPMTQQEIEDNGWLRPLSNKEILGICLLNRANCLRSMKQHDAVIETLGAATKYLPDNPRMRQAIARNQNLERRLHAADRWDELWDEVESLPLPTTGPMFERFQNRKLTLQSTMNQSTNLAEIESAVVSLKNDLRQYRNELSDNPQKLSEAYGAAKPSLDQQQFLTMIQGDAMTRRIRIPEANVPPQYWLSMPPELAARVQKLATPQEIIEELNAYAAEEVYLQNLASRHAAHAMAFPPVPVLPGQKAQPIIQSKDLPLPWRGQPVPEELQARMASLSIISDPTSRQMRMRTEVNQFFSDQQQQRMAEDAVKKRRRLLDQLPANQVPVLIEIVPTPSPVQAPETRPDLPLTPTAERQINEAPIQERTP